MLFWSSWSYLVNMTLIGNAVYLSMDIPDTFLSVCVVCALPAFRRRNGSPVLDTWSRDSKGFWADIKSLRWVVVPGMNYFYSFRFVANAAFCISLFTKDAAHPISTVGKLGTPRSLRRKRHTKSFRLVPVYIPPHTIIF